MPLFEDAQSAVVVDATIGWLNRDEVAKEKATDDVKVTAVDTCLRFSRRAKVVAVVVVAAVVAVVVVIAEAKVVKAEDARVVVELRRGLVVARPIRYNIIVISPNFLNISIPFSNINYNLMKIGIE